MKLRFLSILVVVSLSITCSKCLEPYDDCVAGAYCQMIYGDILNMENDKTYLEQYSKGKHLLKKHYKYVACGVEQINKNCRIKLKYCTEQVQTEAVGILKIPSHLIYGCDIDTLPYMLFLCQNIKHWPNTTEFPKDFKTCNSVCPLIHEYNEYHLSNGKNVSDFPKDWAQNINLRNSYNRMASEDLKNIYPEPWNYKNIIDDIKKQNFNITKISNLPNKSNTRQSIVDDWLFHSYMEPNSKDQFGTYTSKTDHMCKPSSYVIGTQDELPDKFLGHCQSESTEVRWGNDSIFDKGYYPLVEPYKQCSQQDAPFLGSFLLGLRFLIKIKTVPGFGTRLKYLTASSTLCSGHNWAKLREPVDKRTEFPSDELVCPYLTAICSFRFKRFIPGPPSKDSYITNIKIGCCTVPDYMRYSGIGSRNVEYESTRHDRPVPHVWINQHFDSNTITESYCPLGQFIDRFDLARVYFRIETGESDGYNRKWVAVMRNIFYCNNFQKNNQAFLDKTLYEYLYTQGSVDSEIRTTDFIGKYKCENGFYTGGSIDVKDYGTIDGTQRHSYTYKMLCSANNEWMGGEWNAKKTSKWVNQRVFKQYSPGYDEFKCPKTHAICGLKSIQSYIEGPYEAHITLHGRIFKFICCPIPPFLLSRDCGEAGLILDVETSNQYGGCGNIQGTDTQCKVTYTIGYEQKQYKNMNMKLGNIDLEQTVKILNTFGITKHDMFNEIIHSPILQVGEFAHKLISNVTFSDNYKSAKQQQQQIKSISRKKREPLTLGVILFGLAAAVLPAVVSAISDNIPKPGDGGGSSSPTPTPGPPFKNAEFKNSITLSSKNTTTQVFTIYNGQRPFFYDIVLKCGQLKIYSDQNIRYVRPTLECVASAEMEYIGHYNGGGNNYRQIIKSFTIKGYGLYIDAAPRHGLLSYINWVHITHGVKQLFENNPRLVIQGRGMFSNIFSGTDDSLWESYNPNVLFYANITFPRYNIGLVYRILASCGRFKVYTGKFLTIIGSEDKFKIDDVPKFSIPPFTEYPTPKSI